MFLTIKMLTTHVDDAYSGMKKKNKRNTICTAKNETCKF